MPRTRRPPGGAYNPTNALLTASNTIRSALEAARLFLLNRDLTDGGVGIATTASKVRNTATILYTVDGEFKSKASTDDLWTLTGGNLASGYKRVYLLLLDAAGAATVSASDDVLAAGTNTLPAFPASKAVVGSVTVATAGAAFVPGTTLLSAVAVTDTYFDGVPAAMLPAAPDEDITVV
jgi:hypothetical protein